MEFKTYTSQSALKYVLRGVLPNYSLTHAPVKRWVKMGVRVITVVMGSEKET